MKKDKKREATNSLQTILNESFPNLIVSTIQQDEKVSAIEIKFPFFKWLFSGGLWNKKIKRD